MFSVLNERRNTPPTLQPFKVPCPSMKELTNLPSTPVTPRPKGTMRHDIPHKWKDLRHISIFSLKCAVCFIGVPTVFLSYNFLKMEFQLGKARRCGHCGVIVHYQCSRKVVNTCGLPDEVANYYMENHTTPVGRMNGWIRIFR